ncbi:Short-chain dehydrogenase/reductase family 16C member 6 [Penicillium subrubescens]|uniref:Short-chain dehydrogenase/reductase family 16C member 6 n=1 Tax=Penicillium subrubescens TaxID=1316194 RepID=A0A1Q5UPE8_9EURO|nr:Short-chain dehydrogenase/reductase family 16C member 6 [Penicillium subrubescens]
MTFDLQALISEYSSWPPATAWKVVPPFTLLWAAYHINQYLNTRALNNGVQATFDWKKEIVLVTGGSDGIGAATVLKLAERGTAVIVLDIRPLKFDAPKNVHYYRCDLTNQSELKSVAETLRRTFAVNNLGLVWAAQTFLPDMVAQNHGHFLIMASQTAHLATAGVVDYAATKSAALAIYEGLQTELRHIYRAPAVRVSCVAPSAVQTKMFRGIQTPASVTLLKPSDVGSLVAEILWSGRAQNRMTPALAYISPPTRALPDWMRVAFQDLGKDVMSTLSPHQPMDEE